ncbi:hypothetical protein K1T35_11485 [Pseudonocardia sp. DSM 110487]|uniref:hypothetical protein n=1 Tax=Pseudonocardia sp. DSM 110487 TaxID=2865833 RepID=UPI001C6A7BCE|nr:hypothetical protein [Pseudonocardia sp. DSM 110487]QYN37801.1 hypothetical protein K1T35_11485 [Pseudonocardia sp. DSM 110487]
MGKMIFDCLHPAERGALTGTFYACAYLGFGVPLLLSAIGGDAGLAVPLTGLAVVTAAVAVLLALPPLRRLALSAAAPADASVRTRSRP